MGTTGFPVLNFRGFVLNTMKQWLVLSGGVQPSPLDSLKDSILLVCHISPTNFFLAFFSLSSYLSFKLICLEITQAYNAIPVGKLVIIPPEAQE